MTVLKNLFLFGIILVHSSLNAQEARWFKHQVTSLCSPTMGGRGYVDKGRDKAATYIQRKFRELGLTPVMPDSSYMQTYSFSVNTFPDRVLLSVNGKNLVPGEEFLVDAASSSMKQEKQRVSRIDLTKIKTQQDWDQQKAKLARLEKAYFLSGVDTLCRRLSLRPTQVAAELPTGTFIIPQHGKMSWTVATSKIPATVFYVQDSTYKKRVKKISVDVNAKLEQGMKSSNVIGKVTGTEVPDSFIVIAAHYDHLGKMGDFATFPGASDNASGVAMMLYLATYYAAHPQKYSIVFIGFSGEEAGLKGSKYFTEFSPIPLEKMRFMVNVDIMGDATDGVTVVNATEYPKAFAMLEKLNRKSGYLPEIKSRGKAANSDHYFFSEAGVPSFFLYSNGGQGFYHDVFDKPNTLSMNNIPQVAKLLVEFINGIPGL